MIADIHDAVATLLTTDDVPVYYPDLPRDMPTDVSALPQFAVLTPGGNAFSEGDNSYVKVQRVRCDFRCYGPTGYAAKRAYDSLADVLKAITPQTVEVGPTDRRVGVRLHNATLSAGPVQLIDPETKWPFVYATWGVHGSEVEIEIATGGDFSDDFSEDFSG